MTARVKRFIGLTLLLVLVVPTSALAARWQWQRHQERSALNAELVAAESHGITELALLTRGKPTAINSNLFWREVSTEISDAGQSKLWRKQSYDGIPGFVELVPVTLPDGIRTLISLGWTADAAETTNAVLVGSKPLIARLIELPDCPSTDPSDLPEGQTNCPRTMLHGESDINWMLQAVIAPDPLKTMEPPSPDAGPHLGYVGQWILIGLTGVITYIRLISRLGEGLPDSRKRD